MHLWTFSIHSKTGCISRGVNTLKNIKLTNAIMAAVITWLGSSALAQERPAEGLFADPELPRTAHDTPDISGIWQSFTTANWNILSHPVQAGPFAEQAGAWGAGRAGFGLSLIHI